MQDHKCTETLYITIGQRIRVRRKLLGMNRRTLAERTSLPDRRLLRYEEGQSSITMPILTNIAAHLHVPIDYFFLDYGR